MSGSISRRELVAGGVGLAALFAVGGATRAVAGEGACLRPPGAQDEEHFLATCIKCNRCETACPQMCIRSGLAEDGLINWRTPIMNFHRGICDFCGKCEVVCPTGSIAGIDEETSCIGIAVVDEERCIAFQQRGCQVCADACIYGAITLDDHGRPVVDAQACNGCGRCEYKCPSASYLTYAGGKLRGINVEVQV